METLTLNIPLQKAILKQVESLAPVDKFPAVVARWQIGVSMPIPWWHTAAT